jgi:tetratricopeptide (TPR) repeat protein
MKQCTEAIIMDAKCDLKTFEKRIEEEGLVWEMKGELDRALQAYDRLLTDVEAIPFGSPQEVNEKNAVISYLILRKAGVLMQKGELESGEQLMQKALHHAEMSGNTTAVGRAKLGLGVFYGTTNRFEESNKLLTEALKSFNRGDDYDSKQGAGWALLNLGGVFIRQGKLSQAQEKLDEAIRSLKSIENWVGVASAFELKAKYDAARGANGLAQEDLQNAILFYEKQGMKEKADSLRKSTKNVSNRGQ